MSLTSLSFPTRFKQIANHPKSIKYIADTLFAEGVNTPDQLYVAMVLKELLDNVNKQLPKDEQINWQKTLGKSWKNPVILHSSNLKFLALLLKETSAEEGTQASSSWRQNLHPVWDSVLAPYFDASKSSAQIAPFNDFWNVVIDCKFSTGGPQEFCYVSLFHFNSPDLTTLSIIHS